MDRPPSSQKPRPSTSNPKTTYLILYNTTSALLWSTILYRVLSTSTQYGTPQIYPHVGQFVKWTQTLAALEILHSLLGIVRAPLLTTVMQVASRFLIVYGVIEPFPWLVQTNKDLGGVVYAAMLIAHSVTEVIRYGFFAISLALGPGRVPGVVKWLRYNTFFVLYPVGIGSECYLIWLAAKGPAQGVEVGGFKMSWGLLGVLGIYVPGSYVLFTHMMAQRRKVLRGEGGGKNRR